MEIDPYFATLTSKANETYYLISVIGEGATSFVYRCISQNHLELALKIYFPKEDESFNNEISILRKCNHANIWRWINYGEGTWEASFETASNSNTLPDIYFHADTVKFEVFDYFENGELFDYISILKQGFPSPIAKQIFFKIVSTVHYCHENAIYHNDIKWENILLGNDFDIKWIDFGYSSFSYANNAILHNWKGTRCYASPDINNTATKGFNAVKNDCFALGVILFILCIGTKPFNMPSFSDYHYKHIIQGDYQGFWKMFPQSLNLEKSLKEWIVNWLAYDSWERFNTEQIWKSEWMNSDLNNGVTCDRNWEDKEGDFDGISNRAIHEELAYQKEFEYRKIIVDTTKKAKLM